MPSDPQGRPAAVDLGVGNFSFNRRIFCAQSLMPADEGSRCEFRWARLARIADSGRFPSRKPLLQEGSMNSGDRTKMRRYQSQAAQVRREADATTDEVARQHLVERASKYQRIADLKRRRKTAKAAEIKLR